MVDCLVGSKETMMAAHLVMRLVDESVDCLVGSKEWMLAAHLVMRLVD